MCQEWHWRSTVFGAKWLNPPAVERASSGCGILVADVAQPGTDLHVRGRRADNLVVALHPERNAIVAGALVDVLDRKAALDLALAGLVRRAIVALLRARVVAPVPFDGGAV